jgi:hypothetical protein
VAAGFPSSVSAPRADLEPALAVGQRVHRVHAVHDQVEQDLLELHAIP